MNKNTEQKLIDHLQPPRNLSPWFALPVCLSVCGAVLSFTAPAPMFLFSSPSAC